MADTGKTQELRDKGAEFTQIRAAVAQVSALPVVAASATARASVAALNTRAEKLQGLIEQIGKMIDGARRWFADTFSLDVSEQVPFANTAIDGAIQSAIAGMNYFIRDAKNVLARIEATQKIYDAASDEQKKNMLGDLSKQSVPAIPAPSGKALLIVAGIIGALYWLNSRKGSDHGEAN